MAVTVYSTPTCPWCKKAKEWLTEKGVDFSDVDVSADADKAKEMQKKSGSMSVPVIDINGTVIVGYNEREMEKALNV